MMRSCVPVILAAVGACLGSEAAAEWVVEDIPLDAPVSAVRQAGGDVYVRANEWSRLVACEEDLVCLEAGAPPEPEIPPDGIPDGVVTEAENDLEGVRRAWYAEPTDSYQHGALGDTIEAGALMVQDVDGRFAMVRTRSDTVFEDIAPRIADFDDDGDNEVLAIRSSAQAGAAIVVFQLAGGTLAEIASIPPIGRANRWLNVAGIADFTGNRHLAIAIVKTPHIGGTLEIYTLERSRLRLVDRAEGFSNHVFGSTELDLSAVADTNGDRIVDLVLPSTDRQTLRMVSAARGTLRELVDVPLPGAVSTAIGVLMGDAAPLFITGLEDGQLVAVRFEEEPPEPYR